MDRDPADRQFAFDGVGLTRVAAGQSNDGRSSELGRFSRAGGGNFKLEGAEHVFQQLSVSGIALEVAHRVYVLETGVIVQTGTGKELLASEEVQKAYLGM
jgi:hypothetical protein